MIENFEQRLLELKHQLVRTSTETDKGGGIAFYRDNDREHETIKSELIAMIESLSIIKSNIEFSSDSKNPTYHNLGFDLTPIDQTIKKLSNALYFDVPATLCEYNFQKAEQMYKQQEYGEAYLTWTAVLKHDPANKCVHACLIEIPDSQPYAEKFRRLHRDCRLEYMGSFGHDILKQAGKIIALAPDNTIFASDHIKNAIHRFDEQGNHTGTLFADLNYPLGLFTDPENHLWICDMKNGRLLCCNPDGKVLRKINLRSLFRDQSEFIYPLFGCVYHDSLYLRCSNRYFNKAIMVRLDLQGKSFQIVDGCNFMHIEDDLKVYDNILYSHDYHAGILYKYDFQKGIFENVLTLRPYGGFRHFVKSGPNFIICLDDNILKFSQTGEMTFCVPVSRAANNNRCGANDIEIIKSGKQTLLLVTDDRQKCIHKFII